MVNNAHDQTCIGRTVQVVVLGLPAAAGRCRTGGWRTRRIATALMLLVVPVMLGLGMVGAHAGTTVTTVTYVYTNLQGSVLAKADGNGAIIARYTYRPYGTQQSGPTNKGPGYTGHVNDSTSGLVYMQQRYYDPVVGRFISPDPVAPTPGNIFSFNRYAYANDNPIVNIDPTGAVCIPLVNNSSGYCERSREYSQIGKRLRDNGAGTVYFKGVSDLTSTLADIDLPGGKGLAGISAPANSFLNDLSRKILKFNKGQAGKILSGQMPQSGPALDARLARDEQSFVQHALGKLKESSPKVYGSVISTLNEDINGNSGFVAGVGRGTINLVSGGDARVSQAASIAQRQLGGKINYANEHDRLVFAHALLQLDRAN